MLSIFKGYTLHSIFVEETGKPTFSDTKRFKFLKLKISANGLNLQVKHQNEIFDILHVRA